MHNGDGTHQNYDTCYVIFEKRESSAMFQFLMHAPTKGLHNDAPLGYSYPLDKINLLSKLCLQ